MRWHAPVESSAGERRGFVLRRLEVFTDLLALLVTGGVVLVVLTVAGRPVQTLDLTLFLLFVPIWPLIGVATSAYHPSKVGRGLAITVADEFGTIFRVSTIWAWFFLLARSVISTDPIQVIPSALAWGLSIPIVLLGRSALRTFARSRGWYNQDVVVVGRRADASRIVRRIARHPEWGVNVAVEVEVDEGESRPTVANPVASAEAAVEASALLELADRVGASRVIFATPPGQLDARTDLTRSLIESGVQVDFVPGEAEILRSGAAVSHLEGLPLMSMPGARPPRSWGMFKRAMDLMIAVPALVLVSPLLAYAAVRIKRDSPGPVFYRQERAGLDGRPFNFLKLRTMCADADERLDEVLDLSLHEASGTSGIFKAADDPRVTRVGRKLRRHSLDEMPQLINVVRGDMSLVGPRPLPVYEDARVAAHYALRRHVRPGMTGPWQVNGRSDIPFHDMLRLDYSYVLNWSLGEDLKLLTQTVDAVLRGRGAY